MDKFIRGVFNKGKEIEMVDIFGYSTKGLPGLELNGFGVLGKNIKEKIIYLTKKNRVKIPLNRYVICADFDKMPKSFDGQKMNWLELPVIILYWVLAGKLDIRNPDQCVSGGRIFIDNKIEVLEFNPSKMGFNNFLKNDPKFLFCDDYMDDKSVKVLPIDVLLQSVSKFNFIRKNIS